MLGSLVQVLFTGEKIGVGMGKTRKDAQQQAAENALHSLAGKPVLARLAYSNLLFLLRIFLTWVQSSMYFTLALG